MEKKTIFLSIGVLLSLMSYSQNAFKYQAVLRDNQGNLIVNEQVDIRISILQGIFDGSSVYSEEHVANTNDFGLINFNIGHGQDQSGDFSSIDWGSNEHFLQIELNRNSSGFVKMGTAPLLSVPYALHAQTVTNNNDADADPANEIQQLSLSGDSIQLTKNGGTIKLPAKVLGSNGNEVLFCVVNDNNDTVFAVYQSGVRIYINETTTKAARGGFAVASSRPGAKNNPTDILTVTPDSVRIYLTEDTTATKAARGGFAVASSRPGGKALSKDILRVTDDSVRIYLNDNGTKAARGGFAVASSRPGGKTGSSNFMYLEPENYFIGHEGGSNLLSGIYNSTLGYQSGKYISTGESNAFLGYQSGFNNNEGSGNLFLGYQTGFSNTIGNYNSFIGYQAGYSNTEGLFNTFIGSLTGYGNTTGYSNTCIGDSSGYSNINGFSNTFVGTSCGQNNISGSSNVFLGHNAGYTNTTGLLNVFIGKSAGRSNIDGDGNVLIGHQSGEYIETGSASVIIGNKSGKHTKNTWANTFVGYQSGMELIDGRANTFIGGAAGNIITDGERNTFIGMRAGYRADTCNFNTFVGANAGYNSSDQKAYSFGNIYLGSAAGYYGIGGEYNVFIGYEAGRNNQQANKNVFLGYQSGYSNSIGDSNVFIGNSSGIYEIGSNKLYIDNRASNATDAFIYGDFENDQLVFNTKIGINAQTEGGEEILVYDPLKSASIRVRGVGDSYNYSKILFDSDETIRKSWRLSHTLTNEFVLEYNNGVSFSKAFTIKNNGNFSLNGDFLPELHETYNLGKTDSAWNTIFALNGTIETSDYRLKENIASIVYGLSDILKLKPVSYYWKYSVNNEKRIGLIAQDVEDVIKEVVHTGNDEFQTKGINYSELIPVLIKGMQEQQQIIETQNLKIEVQQKEIEQLKQLKQLEQRIKALEEQSNK